jgi:hypothetical protein
MISAQDNNRSLADMRCLPSVGITLIRQFGARNLPLALPLFCTSTRCHFGGFMGGLAVEAARVLG